MSEYLIKTKEAITRCFECPFRDGLFCLASDEKPINKYRGIKTRESFCPLVEVPTPHGRLGDLDALEESLEASDEDIYTKHILWDAPTIIEASEEKE